jgi:hypothetical protein
VTVKTILSQLASLALLLILVMGRAEASFVITVYQAGSNVVATGSGSIDTDGLFYEGADFDGFNLGYAFVTPNYEGGGTVGLGFTESHLYVGLYLGNLVGDLVVPTFGQEGVTSYANTGSGDRVEFTTGAIIVPIFYESGSPLSEYDTWDSTTIADLGLTPGAYVETWGSGANLDSLTLDIGGPNTSSPEPASVWLLGLGGIGLACSRLYKGIVRE